ncbi:hypothetical protein BDN72DRAFT_843855 [Pluteus cervinus]|uniref:Uncharacterized protein n=1 Tax=Pluteus cervinus TaxID=181527 RepID=A0ACD3AP58_9AGAR|nr:hypothetical protein BDN72DRAFT_843855 [Pluteus cervinus]
MAELLEPAVQDTATYQALHNDLIFTHICELVKAEEGYLNWHGLALKLLSSLSRTCKAFSHIALKTIWRDLESLFPLVQTMPSDCWEIIHSRDENATVDHIHTLRFTRPITAGDCERFRFYAPFVRTILNHGRNGRAGDLLVDPNVFHFLGVVYRHQFENGPLLPSLDELIWCINDDLVFPHFIMLLNPNLGKISISLDGDLNLRLYFLNDLIAMCPQLQSITIHSGEDLARIAGISPIFCLLPKLQSLSVEAVSTDTYIRLSKHQELAKFSLDSLDLIDWDVVDTKLQGVPAFPSLRDLEVDGTTGTQFHRLLQTTSSSLQSINVKLFDFHTGPLYGRLLAAMKDCCSSTLQKVHLLSYGSEENDFTPGGDPLIPDHLAPLLAFPNLTYLSIRPTSDVQVDENWIHKIAESVPNIRTFFLLSHNSDPGITDPPRLSIDCLVHFALNCPHLEVLGLAFDARGAVLSEKASRRPTLHPTRLNALYVGHSRVGDPYTVAAIFSDWFPMIYHIRAGPVGGGSREGLALRGLQQSWREVEDAIPMVMRIRNQERRGLIERLLGNPNGGANADGEDRTASGLNGALDGAMEVDD